MFSKYRLLLVLVFIQCFALGTSFEVYQQRVVVNASELCILPITPSLFRWDKEPGYINQIHYIAKISNSPDLPGWLKLAYDSYNSIGYLYGVPPVHLISLNLDVIGWNKQESYDVRKLIVSMEIMRKDPMRFVVEMKVDNLNIKELSIPRRMNELVNVLSEQLSWIQNDGNKVVPVFMASAVEIGENRVPVRASEAEGVVIHFASDLDFSPELKKLQVEVLPLWKLRPCPRDLKRTSVERHFRRHSFLVDWCSFRLITHSDANGVSDNLAKTEKSNNPQSGGKKDGDSRADQPSEPPLFHFRQGIPERTYGYEILLSTLIPGSIGGLVGILIIVILRNDREEEASIDEDTVFFEAAFRTLQTMLRLKSQPQPRNGNGNGNQYIYHQAPQVDAGIVVMTRDNGLGGHVSEERELRSTPVPPQYTETHPNGAPALIYAV